MEGDTAAMEMVETCLAALESVEGGSTALERVEIGVKKCSVHLAEPINIGVAWGLLSLLAL